MPGEQLVRLRRGGICGKESGASSFLDRDYQRGNRKHLKIKRSPGKLGTVKFAFYLHMLIEIVTAYLPELIAVIGKIALFAFAFAGLGHRHAVVAIVEQGDRYLLAQAKMLMHGEPRH